jgi:hypothetical protein
MTLLIFSFININVIYVTCDAGASLHPACELREELAVELGSNQSSRFNIFWVLGLYHANTPEVPICERRLLAWPEVITSWPCGGEDSRLVHIYAGGVFMEDVWIV